jgi:hypothetical protein
MKDGMLQGRFEMVFMVSKCMTRKLHSHGADFGMKWVNFNERMANGESHLGFAFVKILSAWEFGCGY